MREVEHDAACWVLEGEGAGRGDAEHAEEEVGGACAAEEVCDRGEAVGLRRGEAGGGAGQVAGCDGDCGGLEGWIAEGEGMQDMVAA